MRYEIDPAENAAALKYFVQTTVTDEMIQYLVDRTRDVIQVPLREDGSEGLPVIKGHRGPPSLQPPPLKTFIKDIVERSSTKVATLMSTLVYLSKLRARLPQVATGRPCTRHRIFLAALIITSKYLNDSSHWNRSWTRYVNSKAYPGFSVKSYEVNLMEKQLLFLLDWDLAITQDSLFYHLEPFLSPIRDSMRRAAESRNRILAIRERNQRAGHASPRNNTPYRRYRSDDYPSSGGSSGSSSRVPSLSPPRRPGSAGSHSSDSDTCSSTIATPTSTYQQEFESAKEAYVVQVKSVDLPRPPPKTYQGVYSFEPAKSVEYQPLVETKPLKTPKPQRNFLLSCIVRLK